MALIEKSFDNYIPIRLPKGHIVPCEVLNVKDGQEVTIKFTNTDTARLISELGTNQELIGLELVVVEKY